MIGKQQNEVFGHYNQSAGLNITNLRPKYADWIGVDSADYITSEQHSNPAAVPLKCDLYCGSSEDRGRWYKMRPSFQRRDFVYLSGILCILAGFYFEVGYRRNYFLCLIIFLGFIIICWTTLDPLLSSYNWLKFSFIMFTMAVKINK